MTTTKKTLLERIKAALTPPVRKRLYEIGAALALILVAHGVITANDADLIGLIIAAVFGVARANVTA